MGQVKGKQKPGITAGHVNTHISRVTGQHHFGLNTKLI
jgi:hypothetical protein